jgi:FkbM family methyltransferase
MINNLINKFIIFVLSIFDYSNKLKVKNFFKKNFLKKNINIVDIGSHKGETINFFLNNFKVDKIYSIEPNRELYKYLIRKNYPQNVEIFNVGISNSETLGMLNIMRDTSSSTFNNINQQTKYFKRKNRYLSFFDKDKKYIKKTQETKLISLTSLFTKKNIQEIDILKIDTEGYEYKILKGITENNFKKIKFIYFEHHYDLMIEKKYKFSDINQLLLNKKFKQSFKTRMKFRKSFEYIYENQV